MANAAVFGGLVLLLCIGLFIAGVRMDESSMMPMRHDADADKMPDMMPMRRSLEALQYENTLLRSQINATFVENSLLRTKLRAALPPGAKLDVDLIPQQRPTLPTPRMVRISVGSAAGAASDTGRRPRALAERLRQSTEFTQERARAVATNNQIILTFVNRVRLDFATTWVMHVKRLGLTNWLIGATDRASLRELRRSRYPCFDMSTNLPEGEWPWGSPSFKALGPHKIELIYKSIVWGLEVVITDIDALVLREPFAFFKPWPDAGFLTTSDHLGNTTSDGKLEDHRGIHTAFNIGCAHRLPPGALRSTCPPARLLAPRLPAYLPACPPACPPAFNRTLPCHSCAPFPPADMLFRKSALPLVEEWRRVIRADPRNRWDQGEFNRLARYKWKPNRRDGLSDPRLFWSFEEKVIGGVLPLALFCGGHNYFVSQFAQRQNPPWEPYSIHTTYQYAAAAGKRHRLREAMVWYDPPEYYNPPGGLLTFTLNLPHHMVYPPGGMTVRGHIALINFQLRQMRGALALATALNRKLVLPAVTCGYDKYWGPLWRGVIPGTHTWAVPIRNCPLDHFLEVGMLDPVANVREYSLLRNSRTPEAVRSSIRHEAVDFAAPAGHEVARLVGLSRSRVLNITSILGADARSDLTSPQATVLSQAQKRAYERKFGWVSGSWCCAPTDEMKKGAPRSAHFRLATA